MVRDSEVIVSDSEEAELVVTVNVEVVVFSVIPLVGVIVWL
jgi:hypothetical protein